MRRPLLTAALLGTTALIAAAGSAVAQQATPAQPATAAAATAAGAGLTASGLRDQAVYDDAGQEIGRVGGVVVGPGNQAYAVVRGGLFGTRQALVPVSRLGYRSDRFVAGGYTGEQLRALPAHTAGAGGYRDADAAFGLDVTGYAAPAAAGTQTGQAGEGTNIVVQQAAPAIRVEQAAPQVTVQQPRPQVTVRQQQPEIVVRQSQPTVAVDIPQPEIIVRMPPPEVAVAQAQPRVEVRQAQPQVQLVQPEQPQVQVQAGAPAAAQVQDAGARPTVRYERAEPKVVVNQARGEPRVRVEQLGQGQAAPAAPATEAVPPAPEAAPPAPPPPSPAAGPGGGDEASAVARLRSELGARETDRGTVVTLAGDVLFDFDSSEVRPEAGPALERLAELIRLTPGVPVVVEGHTDVRGGEAYNLELSRRRAGSVAGWLVRRGTVERSRLREAGRGEASPTAPNANPDGSDDEEGRRRNRRVEVVLGRE